MLCLDATFLIDLASGDSDAAQRVTRWETNEERVAVPLPAYVEWLRGAYLKGGKTLARALELAENLEILPADISIGQDAARFGAEAIKAGRSLATSDLLIAAIVRHHHAVLITRDKDFSGLTGLPVELY